MLHETWKNNNLGQVKVTNVSAKKYKVSDVLTVDKVYTIVNETEEYIFVVDNSGKVGGFYKDYFEKI